MAIDRRGQVFNRLTVIERAGKNKHGQPTWLCRCACGNHKVVASPMLVSGNTQSCGCYRAERLGDMRRTHGQSKRTRAYRIWLSMMTRCANRNATNWRYYGGRGITVCERWASFENFFADMGIPPAGLTLDRINNDLGYAPENCRWATKKEQNSNRRNRSCWKHERLAA